MKKNAILILILLFIALCINVFGKNESYPFDAKISGKGKSTIIFIPGFACSGEVWNETKSKYENDFTCYTLTMAGFADVEPQTGISFINWETGIAKYIKDNRIEKPIIIGHSMGGGLALAIAADYPELVGKIIVVDALPCLAALMNPAFVSKDTNDCSEIVNRITGMTDEQFYQMQKKSIPQLVADTTKQELIISWGKSSDRKTFAEMYCDFSNTDLRVKIMKIKCPSLILLETYFQNVKPAIDEQYKNLETAYINYSNQGLHFIMFDDKEWYFSKLDNFITGN